MGSQAATLTPAEINELATYFSSQSGLFTVHYGIGAPATAAAGEVSGISQYRHKQQFASELTGFC